MSDPGHFEVERTIDSITIGVRHRTDLGDLQALKESIENLGLLQPITITPDGTLLCGRRRLEAVKELGWRSVRVWVRSGISDDLKGLMALQDENLLHKPFSPIESEALYRELKKVLAEDAAQRQEATQFGAGAAEGNGENHGADDSSAPSRPGDARDQAAILVTGANAHQRLERIGRIKDVADDPTRPAHVRKLASDSLDQINNGAPVSSTYERVMDLARQAEADPSLPDLDALAEEALKRICEPRTRRTNPSGTPRKSEWSTRSFVLMWTDMDGWWTHYDAAEIGTELKDAEWELLKRMHETLTAFVEEARDARKTTMPTAATAS
ncbi:ParB N-terminal domain-containing protein [Nocardioides sp. NPDC057772]|uniref:ParB N-terminal domain-containing protein n=1 Tax=Nocardioides sp. NPDC057772 TaxID=3346245 RepID=UPI003671F98D